MITETERQRADRVIAEFEDEQERIKKAIEAAKEKENKKPTQPIKEKTHTPPQPTQPPQQPRPVKRQCPVQQQPIALLPWELAHTSPPEKKKEAISIYGPPIPKIPIPRGRGLK